MKQTFTFDDILIVPSYSELNHDDNIEQIYNFFDVSLSIPVLSSPMDTISGEIMTIAMLNHGGLGIHHRYCKEELLLKMLHRGYGIAISPSMSNDFIDKLKCNMLFKPILVLDVAHGNTRQNLDFCEKLVKMGMNVVSGNIVDKEAALRYLNIGVNYLRVGIGSGSVCTTRLVTGIGYPQGSAIHEINELRFDHPQLRIISDGGHRTTGDIVKALALGADFVMLGGMLAGTDEAEGMTTDENGNKLFGAYRGMASAMALSTRKKEFFVEGIGKNVEPIGSVVGVLKNIKDAINKAFFYTGSRNLSELRECEMILLSDGAKRESFVR